MQESTVYRSIRREAQNDLLKSFEVIGGLKIDCTQSHYPGEINQGRDSVKADASGMG
jgi:hypothetical protein